MESYSKSSALCVVSIQILTFKNLACLYFSSKRFTHSGAESPIVPADAVGDRNCSLRSVGRPSPCQKLR